MPEFNFENLLKISFPLTVVLALLRLTSYYYFFNVPIVDYLEISEIVSLFLSQVIFYLFLLLIPFFPVFGFSRAKPSFIMIFCAIAWAVTCAINMAGDYIKVYLLLYSIPIFVVFAFRQLYRNKWLLAIAVYIYMLMASSIIGRMEALNVKYAYHYSTAEITIDSTLVRSDSSFYYLGKTRNHVFFYDANRQGAIIYPGEKVKKIVLLSKTPQNCAPVFP